MWIDKPVFWIVLHSELPDWYCYPFVLMYKKSFLWKINLLKCYNVKPHSCESLDFLRRRPGLSKVYFIKIVISGLHSKSRNSLSWCWQLISISMCFVVHTKCHICLSTESKIWFLSSFRNSQWRSISFCALNAHPYPLPGE